MNFPSLEEILALSFQRESAEIYTAIPCVITNIPNTLKDLRVDVQPSIDTLYPDGTSEEHSQILGVPVVFPAGRTSMLSFPLFVGDTVLCVFSKKSLDTFKQGNGQRTIASDFRHMDERDAIAIPGLVPFGKSLNNPAVRTFPHSTSDLVLAHNIGLGTEVEIRLKPDGSLNIKTEQAVSVTCSTATLTADTLMLDVGNTTWSGNVSHTGTFTFNGIPFGTHKHTGVQPGVGTSAGPVA